MIASGFIQHFAPLGKQTRDVFFRIIDEYSLFYLKWIEPLINSEEKSYWSKIQASSEKMSWAGLALEDLFN